MNFTTREITIEKIVAENLEFLIPVYQRPYVWDNIEIKKLLEDLKTNFKIKSDKYFVGNTYVIKSLKDNKQNQYEVIDGQQRFTTFWLISLCFKTLNTETKLTQYLKSEKDIRFDFDIRKEVYEYLKGLLDGTAERRFSDVNKLEFLKNIAAGIETIKSYLESEILKEDLADFGDFISNNVVFIFNEAPLNTDLNALFVALGSSGVQLQQSDILKARLLDKIEEKNQRSMYSKIWEASENMSNFFESNVKLSIGYDTDKIIESDFREFKSDAFHSIIPNGEQNNLKGLTISEIIKSEDNNFSGEKHRKEINTSCRSIVTFNLFLLHVLRIYRREQNIDTDIDSMDGKKLLETFKIDEIDNVRDFIELMWKVRYLFDKYVVKWLKDENESFDEEEKLLLSSIKTSMNEDKSYFSRREKEFSNGQMLQSVLYFNNIPNQIWLTPFLHFLLKGNEESELSDEIILKELERIDNIMIPGDKKETSWQIICQSHIVPNFENILHNNTNQSFGTGFNHYWFYKLEYLLWKNWTEREKEQFKRYRITSKNSIEHVFPQHDENKKELLAECEEIDWLNSFGNLALLSVSQNSSYSNQDIAKKKIDFDNKTTYDSLKLAKIYSFKKWNTEEIKDHQKEMNLILKDHYLSK
jgi:uncharacterized protein with ParB-like and HNH nuclease domain